MEIKSFKVNELNKDILNRFNNCFNCDSVKLLGKYKQYIFFNKDNNICCYDTFKNCFIKGNRYSNMVECIIRFDLKDCSKEVSFEVSNIGTYFTRESLELVDKIISYDYLKERNGDYFSNISSSNKCISNDIWDAQSSYHYGLSIIYKNNKGKELYGVVDSKYNIVFEYDENVSKIKRLSSKLLLIENNDGLSSIYEISYGYLFDFNNKIDSVSILNDEILKIKVGEKYQLYLHGKLFDDLYDNVTYDRNILIIEKDNMTYFYDLNFNFLYKTTEKDFYKSNDCIYYKKNNHYIEYNLFNGNKTVIGKKKFISDDGSLIKSNLDKYNYYYEDSIEGEVYLFEDEMYGLSITIDDVSVVKWFKTIDDIKKAKKNIATAIINFGSSLGEFDLCKKMVKQSGGTVGV